MTFRRAFFAAFSTAVLLGMAWGCAATGDSGTGNPGGGANNLPLLPPNDASSSITPVHDSPDSGHLQLNPLCHRTDNSPPCVPDSAISCSKFTPSADASTPDASMGEDVDTPDASIGEDASTPEDASSGGYGGGSGAGGVGGAGGDSAGPSGAGEGGASGAGEAGAAGATNVPVTSPMYACQVQRSEAAPKMPFSQCSLAGPGGKSAPCLTSSDCQAGLGCVADPIVGSSCLSYCCQDADDCERGTYCAERPMRDAITNGASRIVTDRTALQVPVCVPADNCDLSAPYPCARGSECECKSGTACTVVRPDGTTTCMVPGTGKAGQACPCAWGYICTAATSTCLKLCSTRDSSSCGDGKCQSASQLPEGWGVCIDAAPSGG